MRSFLPLAANAGLYALHPAGPAAARKLRARAPWLEKRRALSRLSQTVQSLDPGAAAQCLVLIDLC
jgi:hypothetical protein